MPKMAMNSFRNKRFRQSMRGVNMERGGLKNIVSILKNE
jgi:hypothetical protein